MSNKLDINTVFNRLYDYFGVKTKSALAIKMGIGQPSVTKWYKNQMYDAIEKRCKTLGIYEIIFKIKQEELEYFQHRNIKDEVDGIIELDNYEQETNVSLDDLATLLKSKLANEIANISDIATLSILRDKLAYAKTNNVMSEFIAYLLQYKI